MYEHPTDIELARVKATLNKLAQAVDDLEPALALTAIETFAASSLAIVGGEPELVESFCDGVKRAVTRMRAALDAKGGAR